MRHVWHGTNQKFDKFDDRFLGLSTSNTASRSAFFFSERPETAWDYAESAARKIVEDHEAHEKKVADLLQKMDAAMSNGDHLRYEAICLELEDLEGEAIAAPPAGHRILQCGLSVDAVFEIEASDRRVVTDLGHVLAEARQDGFDAVCLKDIEDTPSGMGFADTHWAVFEAERISILNAFNTLEEAMCAFKNDQDHLEDLVVPM